MTNGLCHNRVAVVAIEILFACINIGNSLNLASCATRRTAVFVASTGLIRPNPVWSEDDVNVQDAAAVAYEARDRKSNKDALIREDYWYLTGRLPPRVLQVSLALDDPQWNAFGWCETSTGNSCTYVSLKQRIPAYRKYGYAIMDGSREYSKLGLLLNDLKKNGSSNNKWDEALTFVAADEKIPPAIIDAELKMILFATAMLTTPNFAGGIPGKELLVARYYANEAHFAAKEMASAFIVKDSSRAIQAWKYGRDNWNSYFQVVNKAITPKVGEPFPKIV